ncbi:MAG: hypothetical protein RR296_08900 [Clostridia bacterium]
MALPGKLTIGFLQEDNPVKAFFRIKPVLTIDAEEIQMLDALQEMFPEDGCIRIVPDKNELANFKNRMRALGRYCALDLRKFPGENEKIRPNKNYGCGAERNFSIVYSDAIGAVPMDVAIQVLDATYVFVGEEVTLRADQPGTPLVLVSREGKLSGPWVWSEARDVAGCILLKHAPGMPFAIKAEAELDGKQLTLQADDGVVIRLMTEPSLFGIVAPEESALEEASAAPVALALSPDGEAFQAAPLTACDPLVPPEGLCCEAAAEGGSAAAIDAQALPASPLAPLPESAPAPESMPLLESAPAPESMPAPESAPAPESMPLLESAPAPESAPMLASTPAPALDLASDPALAPAPLVLPRKPGQGAGAKPKAMPAPKAAPVAVCEAPSPVAAPTFDRRPEPRPEPVKPVDKPWIQKTDFGKMRAMSGRLSLRDQTLMAQSGINPRKGRSLSEVVDDQWRRSRYEQLGHPVPAEATGHPVISPIERAVSAVEAAWQLPEARPQMLSGLLKDESLAASLADCLKFEMERQKTEPDKHMIELEAERLKLMNEIDALRMRRTDLKEQLLEALRQSHKQEMSTYEQKSSAMLAELKRNEEAANGAHLAAEAAGQLLEQTADQLEKHVLDHLMTERAIEMVMRMHDKHAHPARHPELYEPSAGELISDIRVQLEGAGFKMDNDDAVALLAALHTSGLAVISGPTGSGKSQLVRQLAAALGLSGEVMRFAEARSADDDKVRELLDVCDGLTPCMVLFDDVNLPDNQAALDGILRLHESCRVKNLPLYLVLTVQDAPEGQPMPARLLSRGFLIRLDATPVEAAWKPSPLTPATPERAVALSALERIFAPQDELEPEVENRMNQLRRRLSEIDYAIDRRTLSELWNFCASVQKSSRGPGLDALDRAISERALPTMLAAMDERQLLRLPEFLCDLPRAMTLMAQPLPLPPL